MPDAKEKFVGRSVTRLEDRPLLLGQGRFSADVNFPHQLHMRVLRSSHANARLLSIDTSAARATPGVHAVWTAADVADIPPIDFRLSKIAGLDGYRQRVLATDRVRYVGEPVAVVFADDPYLAEDAADRILLDVEELPVLLHADDEPGEFEPGRSTAAGDVRKEYGDLDAAFRNAHAIVALELGVGRHSGVPLETRGAIGRYDGAREVLELHGAAKVPHWNRDQIAGMLGLSPSRVHLYEGHVGGGFGIRGELYPEDVLVCAAALRFRRPVKWIEDRREHLIAANHSRQQLHRIRAAIDAEGRILGIDDEFFHDQGAYVRTHAATVPDLAAAMLPGPYRVPAYRAVGHIRLTNKTPGGTYRAPGRFESTFVRERLLDAIAAKTRHRLCRGAAPQSDLVGRDALRAADRNARHARHVRFRRLPGPARQGAGRGRLARVAGEVKRRRAAGEAVGVGLAMFVEKSGLGPFDGVRSRSIRRRRRGCHRRCLGRAGCRDGDRADLRRCARRRLPARSRRPWPDRSHRLWHGRVRIARHGDDRGGDPPCGVQCSRQGDRACAPNCCKRSRKPWLSSTAWSFATMPRLVLPFRLARSPVILSPASKTLGGRPPGLTAEGWFHTDHMNYPYGVHVAVVQVDRETGAVKVPRYLVAYDIGKAVNPMLVEGQIVGGVVQGLGGTLLEEFLYDDRGEPLSVNFADYLMPTLREIPAIEVVISEDAPSPLNPTGPQGRRRGRRERGRRRHRGGDRRCHRRARSNQAASSDAAAAACPAAARE